MLLIRKKAYARAGLMGNPSDGYQGKTISLIVRDFAAQVTLYEWERIEIVWSHNDQSQFDSVDALVQDVRLHGYYGGIRLVKATIKRFVEYCRRKNIKLHGDTFSVRYESDIPRQVGLAGSSAIIVATFRCLMEFYAVDIPPRVLPSLVLSVENEELGITAGLQDRVIQVYEGLVYMDFSAEAADEISGLRCGRYEPLDPALLPPIYLAYSTKVSEPTEVIHNNLRGRFQQGERAVVEAMTQFARLTDEARDAIRREDHARLARLVDANFDLRRSICRLPAGQEEMIEVARSCGASAKFAGSGGAIIGTLPDDECFDRLRGELSAIGCRVLRPTIRDLTAARAR
jgi:glucuronokinase